MRREHQWSFQLVCLFFHFSLFPTFVRSQPPSQYLDACNISSEVRQDIIPSFSFIKTHKTGSSTVAGICLRVVYWRRLKIHIPPGFTFQRNSLTGKGMGRHEFDALCNHGTFNEQIFRANTKQPTFIFTILRDPAARIISAHNHQRSISWEQRVDKLDQQMPWRTNAYKIVNANAGHLGWYEFSKSSGKQDRNVEMIRSFIEYLNATLDQVLITEHLLPGLVLFHHNTNLSLSEVVPRAFRVRHSTTDDVKVTAKTHRSYLLPTKSQLEKILELALVDRMIYDFFLEKHRRSWQDRASHQPIVLQELQELQCMQTEIANAPDLPSYWDMDSQEFEKMLKKKYKKEGTLG
mmetsp:Transcript_61301/g.126609  ORF Transcript_61301/g.126609 Transcript_61301/m.126609 type:complete len:349 (+) Transcript_61301:301-1347(+)|eukprot:CAMPEP_0181292328 /NCGR_PEP_ID=MMETSP1101-20121128/2449_1 /TAXON_ID=46948 /ORGANISM="Rhodomonas abbreviata, Strain Caron Lab Isolate" /LENGTH=348 /DNA_ID=CAMNT_0023396793 /DNA_START=200 /DNA_END=1246 /DNA_ORIENTATION=+